MVNIYCSSTKTTLPLQEPEQTSKSLILDLLCLGEPVSVSLDSEDSILDLSKLSPGSSYEVSVISILGLDESDPIKDSVMTREYK